MSKLALIEISVDYAAYCAYINAWFDICCLQTNLEESDKKMLTL